MDSVDSNYAQAIKPIRNKMRAYNYESAFCILSGYVSSYKHKGSEGLIDLMPWIAERLLIWLLADEKQFYGSKIMRVDDAKKLVREAWGINNKLKHHYIEDISLFMRMLTLAQLFYQRDACLDVFSRHMLILSFIPDNSKLKMRLSSHFSMPADDFFKIAFSFYLASVSEDFDRDLLGKLAILHGESEVNRFIDVCAVDFSDVRETLRENRKILADEWFQPSLLYHFPLIKHANRLFTMGPPTIARYFDTIVWEFLGRPENADIKKHWEDVFCSYIGNSFRMAGLQVYGEDSIRKLLSISKSRKVCDFLVEDVGSVILVEVKHKNNNRNLPVRATVRDLTSKLKGTVVKGVDQLQQVFDAARGFEKFDGKLIYSVVVTSDDLMLGFSEFISGSDGLKNFVFSANDIDNLCELVRRNVTSLGDFFSDLSERQSKPETRMQYSYMIFDKQPYCQVDRVKHLDDAISDLIDRMRPKSS